MRLNTYQGNILGYEKGNKKEEMYVAAFRLKRRAVRYDIGLPNVFAGLGVCALASAIYKLIFGVSLGAALLKLFNS